MVVVVVMWRSDGGFVCRCSSGDRCGGVDGGTHCMVMIVQ